MRPKEVLKMLEIQNEIVCYHSNEDSWTTLEPDSEELKERIRAAKESIHYEYA